jgi:ParB-like nuclease domain
VRRRKNDELSLASARAAAAEDRTATWVGEFLASRGSDNAILAAALAQKEHWWVGPIEVPLDELERLAGPEDEALVPIAEDEWEGDVGDMAESIEEGWEPPPLLAEYQDGRLLLQDGNHRYEALQREGARDAWVLIYFDNPAERERFLARRR